MIRTTISKIKKVCAIAFVPRLLRGNLRYTPSIYGAFGKFEKFTPNVKSVQKSTKASGDDTPLQPQKNQLKDGISVVSLSKPLDLKSTHECLTEQKVPRLDIPGNIAATPTPALAKTTAASHLDKCSRVISQIFGEEKIVTPQEDLLFIGPVDMTNKINNNKLVTYKRTPVITFDRCKSKNFRTTPHVDIEKTPDKNQSKKDKDNFQSVLCYEAVLMKEKAAKKTKESQNKPAQLKHEDAQQLNTCLYDVDPEEYASQWKVDAKAFKMLTNEKYSEQEIDSYWTDVYETATVNKAVCYEPNQAIDLDTIHMYKSLKSDKTNSTGVTLGTKRINHTKEELDRILRGSPYDADFHDTTLKSTSDKQKEETLDQKLEHIDETPLVEAEKPKIGGFSAIPKVLSNKDKQAPAGSKNKLDEVVHRCLKLPQTQVDKILLKEMEQLGVPITGLKTSDIINTSPQTKSKTHGTMKLDNPKIRKLNLSNQLPNNLTGLRGIKLSATTSQADEQIQRDLKQTNTSNKSKEANKSNIKTAEIRSQKEENANKNLVKQSSHKDKAINQKDEIEINRAHVTNICTKPNPKEDSTPNVWGNDQLDPKYILTCNETCPISPKSIVNPYHLKHLESTEAVYEGNVLDMIEDKEKAKPPIAYVPLDSYLKIIREGNADIINTAELDSKNNLETETESTPELTPDLKEMGYCPLEVTQTDCIRDLEETESEEPIKTCLIEGDAATSDFNYDLEPYHVTQEDMQETPDEDYSAYLVKSIQETSEQLQATTKQLQATSEKLEATSQQLHETSEKLLATSEQLDYRNMMHVCASQLTSNETEGSKSILGHPLVDQSMTSIDPTVKPLNKPSSEPTEPSDVPIMTTLKSKDIDVDQNVSNADVTRNVTESVTMNSSIPVTDPNRPPLKPLTDVKDDIKLSELMKIVQERNQRVSTEHLLIKPAEAKKSIPPMQQPRHKTPVFKTPSYPKLKPRPRVCAPRKRSGPKKTNCSRCNLETLGLDNNLGPRFNRPDIAEYMYDQTGQGVALTHDALPSADLTEEIILQLQNLGYILESAYQRGKVTLESAVLAKTRFQFRTKNYEPWTPIPSWPFPKKIKRQKVQCPKDGCPTPPPRSIYDPPCGLKPCSTFPTHPKRTFTILDYCTIALADPTVVEIGDF